MSATDFIIGVVLLVVGLGVVGGIVTKAKAYEMRIFLSKQYAILCFGAVCGLIAYFLVQPPETGLLVSIGTGVCAFALACFGNIKKSTPAFGVVFTIFQAAMVACFVLIVLAVLNWLSEKAR